MKTKLDFYKMFGIIPGMHYHALDYSIQVCEKSFNLYEEAKTDKERELNLIIAETVAKHTFPPIPIENQPFYGIYRNEK